MDTPNIRISLNSTSLFTRLGSGAELLSKACFPRRDRAYTYRTKTPTEPDPGEMYVRGFYALDENVKSRTLAIYVPTVDIKSGNLGGILKRSAVSWLGGLFI